MKLQEFSNLIKENRPALARAIHKLATSDTFYDEPRSSSELYFIYKATIYGKVDLAIDEITSFYKQYKIKDKEHTNRISAKFLKEFIFCSVPKFRIRYSKIEILNGTITKSDTSEAERISLNWVECHHTILFENCCFEHSLDLDQSDFQGLIFNHCEFRASKKSIYGSSLKISNDLRFYGCVFHSGSIILIQPKIGGSLRLFGEEESKVEEGDLVTENIASSGAQGSGKKTIMRELNIFGSQIEGDCIIKSVHFLCECVLGKEVEDYENTDEHEKKKNLEYAVRIGKSRITGNLHFEDVTIQGLYETPILIRNIRVERNLILLNSRIVSAHQYSISGSGSSFNAVLMNRNKPSQIVGCLDFSQTFVRSDIDLSAVSLACTEEKKTCLELIETECQGSVLLSKSRDPENPCAFQANGRIRLDYIRISKQLKFAYGRFNASVHQAIHCKDAIVGGRITFSAGKIGREKPSSETKVNGRVVFVGTSCREMDLSDTEFKLSEKTIEDKDYRLTFGKGKFSRLELSRKYTKLSMEGIAKLTSISIQHMTITNNLFINYGPNRKWKFQNSGVIDGRDAIIGRLNVDVQELIRDSHFFRISGMKYDYIINDSSSSATFFLLKFFRAWYFESKTKGVEQCGWFSVFYTLDDIYQPYEQLARALNNIGDHPRSRFVRFLNGAKFNPDKISFARRWPKASNKIGHVKRWVSFLFNMFFYSIYETGIPAYRSVIMFLILLFIGSIDQQCFKIVLDSLFHLDFSNTCSLSLDNVKSAIKNMLPFFEMDLKAGGKAVLLRIAGITYLALFIADIAQFNRRS